MNIRISQLEDRTGQKLILRIEGLLNNDGAEMLERVFADLPNQQKRILILDLKRITPLDEGSDSLLRRFNQQQAERESYDPGRKVSVSD